MVGSENSGEFDDLTFSVGSGDLSSPVFATSFVVSRGRVGVGITAKAVISRWPGLASRNDRGSTSREALWAVIRVGKNVSCCEKFGKGWFERYDELNFKSLEKFCSRRRGWRCDRRGN